MTNRERKEELEQAVFYLEMKDHWNHHDFELMRQMKDKLAELEQVIKEE